MLQPPTMEQQAEEYIAGAKRKLTIRSPTILERIMGENKKMRQREASQLYVQAADLFKFVDNLERAGQSYTEAANLSEQIGDKLIAAGQFMDAATCYKTSAFSTAIQGMEKATKLHLEIGLKNSAAHIYKEMAILCEANSDERALIYYQDAVERFREAGSPHEANKCSMDIAKNAGLRNMFLEAIELFEQAAFLDLSGGEASGKPVTLAHSAFFSAGICHLCQNVATGEFGRTLVNIEAYPNFKDSKEYSLISALAHFLITKNKRGRDYAVSRYTDEVAPLSAWHMKMLQKLRPSGEVEGLN